MFKRNLKTIILCIFILVLTLLIWWTTSDQKNSEQILPNSQSSRSNETAENVQSRKKSLSHGGQLPSLAYSLSGTQIDCPIEINTSGQLLLTSGIRNCFDYFFSSLGEKTENQLIGDIQQYLSANLPQSAADYAIKLLSQYIEYKKALSDYQAKNGSKVETAAQYQKITDDMLALQNKFFNIEEAKAFFGNERIFNKFNLAQFNINENKNLNAVDKAKEISGLLADLPDDLAEGIRPIVQYNQLQALTQQIKEKGGSANELRAVRENLVGAAAADRLEKVDKEEASWTQKVNNYLEQRDVILNGQGDKISKQNSIESLRQQQFYNKEEQVRAQTFEQMHDSKLSQ